MNKLSIILKGIIKENPTFVLVLGMCPTLGNEWYGYGCCYYGSAYYVELCDFVHQEFDPR